MRKTNLIVGLVLVAASVARAMPEGSFDCQTKDGKTSVSLEISNYGEHMIVGISSLTLNAKEIDLRNDVAVVSRQWVDDGAAKIDIGLPHGIELFSKALILETKSTDHGTTYVGTAKIEVREDDYSSPLKTVSKMTITCIYNP